MIPLDQVICGDCLEVLPTLPENSVNAIITDPPYGIGLDEWDKPVNLAAFMAQVKRVGRDFFAVFGMMPTIVDWHLAAKAQGFHFLEHIVWAKRIGLPSVRLSRSHEEIFIYAIGKNRAFYTVKGPWEDIRIPQLLTCTASLEGIDRHIKDLRGKLAGTTDGQVKVTTRSQPVYERFNGASDRSPEKANFTNVWSFLPPSFAIKDGEYLHPTEKPISVMERLVEMLTQEGGIVLDPFLGSGTTALGAKQEGRHYIGIEKDPGYCEIARRRLGAILL